MVKGVHFILDKRGQKKAVLIYLKEHKEIWEDFYDTSLVKERENEPRETLKEVKRQILGREVNVGIFGNIFTFSQEGFTSIVFGCRRTHIRKIEILVQDSLASWL